MTLCRGLGAACLLALAAACSSAAAAAPPVVLDDFRDAAAWQASASDQVKASLRREAGDGSLCLDYDFAGVSGYAVMRRPLPQRWPAHFDITARLKGGGGANDLQMKLVDAGGDNVWWARRPDVTLPPVLTDTRFRSRQVTFAWGPAADRTLRETQFIEFVVAAGRDGGKGSLCLARLTLAEREPDPATWPTPTMQAVPGAVTIDFGRVREFNGVALQWPAGSGVRDDTLQASDEGGRGRTAGRVRDDTLQVSDDRRRWRTAGPVRDYTLQASDDGRRWRTLRHVRGSDGGLDTLFLPDSEARHLRVTLPRGAAAPQLQLKTAAEWPHFDAVLAAQAAALRTQARKGDMPRAYAGEQNYWTLVGVDGAGQRSALMDEDGAIEIGRGGWSLAPAVRVGVGAAASTVTWADVQATQSLREGHLPLPAVHWRHDDFALDVEATADGPRTAPQLLARYTLRNRGPASRTFTLLLALRPWQVNPPQQFLSTPGGASPVRTLAWDGRTLVVDGRKLAVDGRTLAVDGRTLAVDGRGRTPLRFTVPPARYGALPFDGGQGLDALRAAPAPRRLADPQSHASALLQWRFTLAPGESRTVGLVAPLGEDVSPGGANGTPGDALSPQGRRDASLGRGPPAATPGGAADPRGSAAPVTEAALSARFDAAAAHWRERLNRVTLELPGADGRRIADTLRSSLAHMLMSRDGPALRPGTRSYARTWVRDGAMMVAGLVRLGEIGVAREFVDWFAPHVFASGKVPCCVDERGADPVAENDSHGQYLYSVAEVLRHAGVNEQARAWAAGHWPRVRQVLAYMEGLRQSERSDANRTPQRAHLFGLMPPSISHEGYSDKPAYSYWDDFWALRGYKDAVWLAQRLGHADEARDWAAWRDEFAAELAVSIAATARFHRIDVIAGAADRGDFDATSTTMALNPAQAALPPALLRATFERYWQEMNARTEGRRPWKDYTPYELRTVGALARLGWPDRAHAMLAFFFRHQRPPGWNQWAEVVLPDAREPRFLGDMPHAWVSSDFVRSALDLIAYEDEAAAALVLGAGLPAGWLQQGDVRLQGLSTWWGPLDLRLQRTPAGWRLLLPRPMPGLAGRLRLRWPEGLPLPRPRLAEARPGTPLSWQGRELELPPPPLDLVLESEVPR